MRMQLPELPRKNKRKEAHIDGKVARWFEKHHPKSILIEVKLEGGTVTEHQQRLINSVAERRALTYKFPDGGRRTPLDYIVLKDADVALCVCSENGKCVCTINNEFNINIKV